MILVGAAIAIWIIYALSTDLESGSKISSAGATVGLVDALGRGTGKRVSLSPGTRIKFQRKATDPYAVYLIEDGPHAGHWALVRLDDVRSR